MRRTIAILAIVIGCQAPLSLSAQNVVLTPAGVPFPSDTDLQRNTAGDHELVWLAAEGLAPSLTPGGPPRDDLTSLKFMDEYSLVAGPNGYSQKDGNEYRMLVLASGDGKSIARYVGWVDDDLLVFAPHAELDVTTIYRKVMIVNSREDLENANLSDTYDRYVPVRLRPDLHGAKVPPCRLFDVFFKWGEIESSDGTYVLIGPDWDFSNRSTIEERTESVLGWVPANRISRWNTREALDWDDVSTSDKAQPRRLVKGYIWKSASDALAALEFVKSAQPGAAPPGGLEPLAIEGMDENGYTAPLKHEEMRFPILEVSADDKKTLEPGGKINPDWNPVCVGVVGDFVDENGVIIAKKHEILNLQNELEGLRNQMATIEVLFVIDDTSSMKPVFAEVAESVELFGNQIQSSARNVRVGVAYYNDKDDLRPGHEPVKPMRLENIATTDMFNELRRHLAVAGGDIPEMVFDGLVQSVEGAAFSPEAIKLVVLLGDAGDRDADAGDVALNAAVARAAAVLNPENERPIDFYAIQVRLGDEANRLGYREGILKFNIHMNALVAHLKSAATHDDQNAELVSAASLELVKQRLETRLKKLVEQSQTAQQRLGAAQGSQMGRNQLGPSERAAIERRNPNFVKILESAQGVQLFSIGYAWVPRRTFDPNVEPQPFRQSLLLDGADLKALLDPLSELVDHYHSAPDKGEEVLKNSVIAQVGQGKDKSLSWEQNAKLQARGLTLMSPLLKTRVEELDANVFRLQELYDLAYKRDQLTDIQSQRRYHYERKAVPRGGATYFEWQRMGEPARENRAFKLGGQTDSDAGNATRNWYWIDKMREWP